MRSVRLPPPAVAVTSTPGRHDHQLPCLQNLGLLNTLIQATVRNVTMGRSEVSTRPGKVLAWLQPSRRMAWQTVHRNTACASLNTTP